MYFNSENKDDYVATKARAIPITKVNRCELMREGSEINAVIHILLSIKNSKIF